MGGTSSRASDLEKWKYDYADTVDKAVDELKQIPAIRGKTDTAENHLKAQQVKNKLIEARDLARARGFNDPLDDPTEERLYEDTIRTAENLMKNAKLSPRRRNLVLKMGVARRIIRTGLRG